MATPNLKQISIPKLISLIVADSESKSLVRIISEMTYLMFKDREIPRHYFSRFLFKRDCGNIKDYFSTEFLYRIKPYFNEAGDEEVLENKLYFNLFYSQFALSLPKILMYNNIKAFVIDGQIFDIKDVEGFKEILKRIIKSSSSDSLIIKKTYGSYGGDSIYKLTGNEIENNIEKLGVIYKDVTSSAFLFQETIIQHPHIDLLNPSCVNSIRFDTFIDKDGNVEIISGYIRMSIRNLCVDNISSGGCQVAIDLANGKLRSEGYSLLRVTGVKTLLSHPLTGTVFKDFDIPYFNEAKELVIKAASLSPGLRLVGWDVAISDKGPVLIEGNSNYDSGGNDLSEKGYRTNHVFRKLLEETKSKGIR